MASYIGDKADASAAKLVRLPGRLSVAAGTGERSWKAAGAAPTTAAAAARLHRRLAWPQIDAPLLPFCCPPHRSASSRSGRTPTIAMHRPC